ncbi:MAG: hypothetical protein ACRED3_12295 [Bradyrhizobium sp.]
MKRALPRHLSVLLLLLLLPALRAAEEDPQVAINAKLRESLRNTMVQLQTAQGQVATLQATQTADEARIKDLEAQLKKLTKQAADNKLAADKTIADQKQLLAEQDARNARQLDALAKWKDAYNKLVDQARAIDGKRADLASKVILKDRQLAEAQRKNAALYDLGKEILRRYEHYGLGDAIAAREPFTGIAKVKLENYVQDQGDKLADGKIKN